MSIINQMIDRACRVEVTRRPLTNPEKQIIARDRAGTVIRHIDEMYPDMWKGVPKTARTSVRNTVVSEILQAMEDAQ